MKKAVTTLLILILLGPIVFGQMRSAKNPSVAYIEKMGYQFVPVHDMDGNERGNVIFPDGSQADAWSFLKGESGKEFSYCASKGFKTESVVINHDGFREVVSVCVRADRDGKSERIPMLELMERNGEPLMPESPKPDISMPGTHETDPGLKVPTLLPDSFDWRKYNGHTYIGPVRNQGSCGACYAFGAAACAEGVYNFATGKYDANCIDLSESFIIWCLGTVPAYGQHFFGCNGADYSYTELTALVDSGSTFESYFPYQTNNPGTCTHWNDPRIKFSQWYRVGCSDIAAIKTAIMTYGVVDASVILTTPFYNYSGGVFSDTYTSCYSSPCYYTPTSHVVSLVGWGIDPVEGEYWILRNSWGAGWGDQGYMKIKMTSARVACEVSYLTMTPVVQTAPVATTLAPAAITVSGAGLNGSVAAGNSSTVVTYEYGTTTAYGNTVNAAPSSISGNTTTTVTATLTGLLPSTLYHYRIKAVNSIGTAYGSDAVFTTLIPACTDLYEPNNTQSAAPLIAIETEISGMINPSSDQDWFRFSNTSAMKNIQVDLYSLPADYDLQLYDATGKLLKTSQKRGTTSEVIKYNTTKVGTYYAKVYGYNGAFNTGSCYKLKVKLSSTNLKSSEETDPFTLDETTLKVYPVPTMGNVHITFMAGINGKAVVTVTGLTGSKIVTREVNVQEGSNTIDLDLSAQGSGIYILDITSDTECITRKIILQK